MIAATFFFASKSGVNGGIISAIFSSSCVFTIVIFYFKYGHKISVIDSIGTVFIITCVLLIAFGGTDGDLKSESQGRIKTFEELQLEKVNLTLSILFSILSGFVLSLNTVSIQYTIYTGFDLDQANYDGNCILGVFFFPFFIYF